MEEPTIEDIVDRASLHREWDYNYTSTGRVSGYKCRVHFKLDSFEEVKTVTAREEDELQNKVDKLQLKYDLEASNVGPN